MAKVTLLSPTELELTNLTNVIKVAWDFAKTNSSLEELSEEGHMVKDLFKHFEETMQQYLPLGQFLHFIWAVEEVPRAFMDQLDRHHAGHYWEQSFRVLDLSNFATRANGYYIPQYISNIPFAQAMAGDRRLEAAEIYGDFMAAAQEAYNDLVRLGMPTEQARGVIPLHVNTRTTFSMPWYHGLREMLASRSCFISQGEYWFPVINGMIAELRRIGFPEGLIKQMTTPPCRRAGKCTVEKNMLERLENDPNDLCPLYIDQYNTTPYSPSDLVQVAVKKNNSYLSVAFAYASQIADSDMYKNIHGMAYAGLKGTTLPAERVE